jgi:hypothetical protein
MFFKKGVIGRGESRFFGKTGAGEGRGVLPTTKRGEGRRVGLKNLKKSGGEGCRKSLFGVEWSGGVLKCPSLV